MLAPDLSLIIPLAIGAGIGVFVWIARTTNERDRARVAGDTPRPISPWGSIVACAAIGGVVIGGFWTASHESQARAAHNVLQQAIDREGAAQVRLAGALQRDVSTQDDLASIATDMHGVEGDVRQVQATLIGIDRGDYGPDELALVDAMRRVNVAVLDYATTYERLIDGHLMTAGADGSHLADADRTALIRKHIAFDTAWLALLPPAVKLHQVTPEQAATTKGQLEQAIATLQSCLCQQAS